LLKNYPSPLKLNLGCHFKKLDGFVNVDFDKEVKPEVVWDLNKMPWPFKAGSVDYINGDGVLEHLGYLDPVFAELSRILKVGGEAYFSVPYVTNAYSISLMNYTKWHNHTHIGFIHDSFDRLCEINGMEVYKRQIAFARPYQWLGLQWLFNKIPGIYNHFFLFSYPAHELRVWVRKKEQVKKKEFHN
jgi:SAM-dependent methyltransferase